MTRTSVDLYWQGKKDESATTDKLALDRRRLEERISEYQEWKIRDIVLIQQGAPAWEWHDGQDDRVGAVYSCTKSILSALIGIALKRGEIDDLEQPISDYFKQIHKDKDPRKKAIRIKHLLTMTPGFDWPDFDKPYWAMKRAEDGVQFVLDRPMAHDPGESFTYNSGGSYLLSAILNQATGVSVYDYASEHLFRKLEFRKPRWNSLAGIHEGGAGLHLASRDMAKFGLLYLQGGRWNAEQIVPEAWVRDSTVMHHKGYLHYEPPIFGEYGYHWWISSKEHNGVVDLYFSKGYGGQYIFVIPAYELVAAIRKEPTGKSEAIYAKRLLFEDIIPALRMR
ncbi:serine hydrolase domain-containing protein [Paenibacillus mendelii]|uniref:Serine hydrolase domain-containing protein n=1 Tax=Paenibacillus mendelii TaxID=206163 RepID=A0ABV6J7I3_9BACL|nr:serine hydrolase [Paenibacillus mendelii]MCQ6562085.1 beta-lactamase family protein [Paenibacillus mendelii]